jgi:2-alkyl-3-oxoalkanoate reductase
VKKIAILGASGFVGSRAVEMFHLGGLAEVRPVVRGFGSLARLSRFDLDWRMGDIRDEASLARAFEGCDFVLHSLMGGPEVVVESVAPAYRAACRAGVKRLVYLSSASVHGQSPALDTDESSRLDDRQALDYNNWKVRAERRLLHARSTGPVEVVLLRPGIVFGPRDRWVTGLANELLAGTAYLVNGGGGICNCICVDNLVHAIQLAFEASDADREAFLLGDAGAVTWAEFYRRVAEMLGVPFEQIHQVPPATLKKNLSARVDHFRSHAAVQKALPFFPAGIKRAVKAALAAIPETPPVSPWTLPRQPAPVVTVEMSELHQCRWTLPMEKATRMLGYVPQVEFEEGLRRSLAWLCFAGCPLPNATQD